MRPLAAVLIARYLVATGRRDAAIAQLSDRSEPWHAPEPLFEELETLEAVDALGVLACDPKIAAHQIVPLARALARRRRFDLLRPLLEREEAWYAGRGALAGLWEAPCVPEDSILVRDWIVPRADRHLKGPCAQFLALVGDEPMARMMIDELETSLPEVPLERAERYAELAPAVAVGDPELARTYLVAAEQRCDEHYPHDESAQEVRTTRDLIAQARAMTKHVARLARDRALPWVPCQPVATVFIGSGSRYGRNRVQQERWDHEVVYAIAARDVATLFTTFEHARVTDIEHAPYLLANIAERLPRAWIERDLAMQLSTATTALVDPRRQDGGIAVIGALAEAGQLAAARALLPHVATIYTSPNVYARLAAHTRDAGEQRDMLDLALTGTGAELELAQFVDTDLRSRR